MPQRGQRYRLGLHPNTPKSGKTAVRAAGLNHNRFHPSLLEALRDISHGTRPSTLLLGNDDHDDECRCTAVHRMLWRRWRHPRSAAPMLYGCHERDRHGGGCPKHILVENGGTFQYSKDILSALLHPVNRIRLAHRSEHFRPLDLHPQRFVAQQRYLYCLSTLLDQLQQQRASKDWRNDSCCFIGRLAVQELLDIEQQPAWCNKIAAFLSQYDTQYFMIPCRTKNKCRKDLTRGLNSLALSIVSCASVTCSGRDPALQMINCVVSTELIDPSKEKALNVGHQAVRDVPVCHRPFASTSIFDTGRL